MKKRISHKALLFVTFLFSILIISQFNCSKQSPSESSSISKGWSVQQMYPPSTWFESVFFIDANTGWVVGGDVTEMHTIKYTILHTSNGGETWVNQVSGSELYLKGVFFIDKNIGWAVGDGINAFGGAPSKILNTTDGGKNWAVQYETSHTFVPLECVYFIDKDIGFAGGVALYRTTNSGKSWETISIEPRIAPNSIYDIFFLDRYTGWACGDEGIILHTTDGGETWVNQNRFEFTLWGEQHGYYLQSIYFANSNDGWAVDNHCLGYSNAFIHNTKDGGDTWNEQLHLENGITCSNSGPVFYDMFFVNANTGWVVGSHGKIFHTTNGVEWREQNSETSKHLRSVFFVDANTGWAVGQDGTILHTTSSGN